MFRPFRFQLTIDMENLIRKITKLTEELSEEELPSAKLILHRTSLCEVKVPVQIGGRTVLIDPLEQTASENAYALYDQLSSFDPFDVRDLLRAHGLLMSGLSELAGHFRKQHAYVIGSDKRIAHLGTLPDDIPGEISDLLAWAAESTLHPLLTGCLLHLGLILIHPFADGNGRTARAWHSLILIRWQPVFRYFPMETLIAGHRTEICTLTSDAYSMDDCTRFILFFLRLLCEKLEDTHSLLHSPGQ